MTNLLRLSVGKLALVFALALVLGGAAWTWQAQPRLGALRRESATTPLVGQAYVRAALPEPAAILRSWPKPRAQSSGPGWVYEIFTPPVIYYHAGTKSFADTPPLSEAPLALGLELLEVRRELYRLQLVGYIGAPGDYVAAFVSPLLPDTLLARSGRRFDELGLSLASIDVRKVDLSEDPALPVHEVAALATVHDERTGEFVTLDSRARKFTDTPLALVRFGTTTKPRVVRAGESITTEHATYRIERIQLDPPEVVVAEQVEGRPLPETRVLRRTASANVAKKTAPAAERIPAKAERGVAVADPRR